MESTSDKYFICRLGTFLRETHLKRKKRYNKYWSVHKIIFFLLTLMQISVLCFAFTILFLIRIVLPFCCNQIWSTCAGFEELLCNFKLFIGSCFESYVVTFKLVIVQIRFISFWAMLLWTILNRLFNFLKFWFFKFVWSESVNGAFISKFKQIISVDKL